MTPKQKAKVLLDDYSNIVLYGRGGIDKHAKSCAIYHCRKQKQAINDLYYQLKPDMQVKIKFEEQVIFWEEVEMEIGRI